MNLQEFMKMRAARRDSEAAWRLAGRAVMSLHWGIVPEHICLTDKGPDLVILPEGCPLHVALDVSIPTLFNISPRRLACPEIPAAKQVQYFEALQGRITRSMKRARGRFGRGPLRASRAADFKAFVKLLGNSHCPICRKMQLIKGLLLKLAGYIRRLRVSFFIPLLDI